MDIGTAAEVTLQADVQDMCPEHVISAARASAVMATAEEARVKLAIKQSEACEKSGKTKKFAKNCAGHLRRRMRGNK